jgi:hypothetical protein
VPSPSLFNFLCYLQGLNDLIEYPLIEEEDEDNNSMISEPNI